MSEPALGGILNVSRISSRTTQHCQHCAWNDSVNSRIAAVSLELGLAVLQRHLRNFHPNEGQALAVRFGHDSELHPIKRCKQAWDSIVALFGVRR
jgi:hypothetical protein